MLVSGTVIFSPNSMPNPTQAGNQPIAGVPIVLQEIGDTTVRGSTTGIGAAAITNNSGYFEFTNVPDGSYRVVEAWGYSGASQNSVDYAADAAAITVTPADPNPSAVTSTPAGTNRINSLSPNTLFIVNASTDQTGLYFVDAPVRDEELALNQYVTIGDNLFTGAEFGTVGFYPNGTPVQTSPYTSPYGQLPTSFQYIQYNWYAPADGYFSVVNTIVNSNFDEGWFNLSDHTTGDETGRMFIVNGDFPGVEFYEETVSVTPNTEYAFSVWICNIDRKYGEIPPELSVSVLAGNGDVLFDQVLNGDLGTTVIPTWVQVGDTVNSGDNTSLTVTFFSQGASGLGNDFAIDDISLFELQQAPVTDFNKSVDSMTAIPGDTLTYTMTFTNTGPSVVENAVVTDSIPNYTTFVSNSLVVNNVMHPDTEMLTGIEIGTVGVGETVTITFQVVVDENIISATVIENSATVTYNFEDETGETQEITTPSNEVETIVNAGCITCPTGPTGPTGPAGSAGGGIGGYLHATTLAQSEVPVGGLLPLQTTISQAGTDIAKNNGSPIILIEPGAYLVNYRTTAYDCNCQKAQDIHIDLVFNQQIYPGGTARATAREERAIDLSGTAIVVNTGAATAPLYLTNRSDRPIHFTDTSITVLRLGG